MSLLAAPVPGSHLRATLASGKEVGAALVEKHCPPLHSLERRFGSHSPPWAKLTKNFLVWMASVPFSPQWVLQALLIKHTRYSAAVICHSLWDFHSWAKWTSACPWKATTDIAAICTRRRLEYFSWWLGSWAGGGMANCKNEWKVRLAGVRQGENGRGSKMRSCVQKVQIAKIKCEISWEFWGLFYDGFYLWHEAIPYYSIRGDIKISSNWMKTI